MPTPRPLLTALACLAMSGVAGAGYGEDGGDVRLLLVGDVLLSRNVVDEVRRTGRDPWRELAPLLGSADVVVGNLEGAVGDPSACVEPGTTCFAVPPEAVPLLASAGFTAMSTENNHAADLGPGGRATTMAALRAAGVVPLTLDGSPSFLPVRGRVVAVVAASLLPGRDGRAATIPSEALAAKLRLARHLADAVVVTVHWGVELHDWPSPDQRRASAWLVARGADLVVGHHPHVVQPAACVDGGAVFFSVGNHLFDQKYPDAKQGLVADCRLGPDGLACGALVTRAPMGSSTPRLDGDGSAVAAPLRGCACGRRVPVEIGGVTIRGRSVEGSGTSLEGWRDGARLWATAPGPLLAAEPLRLPATEETALFTVERRPSPLDGEESARPYVCRVGPRGPVALWRGSGLAWPLVGAVVLPDDPGCICALHRTDSFLVPDPAAVGRRTAAYRWNGFGFDAVGDAVVAGRCAAAYAP